MIIHRQPNGASSIFEETKEEYDRRKYNLSVNRAAQLMGVTEQYIRVGLQLGQLPFGVALQVGGKKQFTYYISPAKFTEFTGVAVPEYDSRYNCMSPHSDAMRGLAVEDPA